MMSKKKVPNAIPSSNSNSNIHNELLSPQAQGHCAPTSSASSSVKSPPLGESYPLSPPTRISLSIPTLPIYSPREGKEGKENRLGDSTPTSSGRRRHRSTMAPTEKTLVLKEEVQITDEMPTSEVIDKLFENIAKELGLPMNFGISTEKKWQIVKQNAAFQNNKAVVEDEMDEILRKISVKGKKAKSDNVRKLRTLLQTKPASWVRKFQENSGFAHLFSIFREHLGASDATSKDIIAECVRCLKAILNLDGSIFEKIIEHDGISLIIRSIPALSPSHQAEIFEFLAVICLSCNLTTIYIQIFDGIRQEIGYQFLVEAMTVKHAELRVNTLVLINGLLWGTDEPENHARIFADLDGVHFKTFFEAVCKSNTDELWHKQAEIYRNFEESHGQTPEAMVLKLKAKLKQQEDEIKFLESKNARLAEKLETSNAISGINVELENLRSQLKQKDNVISGLEEKLKTTSTPVPSPGRPKAPSRMMSSRSLNSIPSVRSEVNSTASVPPPRPDPYSLPCLPIIVQPPSPVRVPEKSHSSSGHIPQLSVSVGLPPPPPPPPGGVPVSSSTGGPPPLPGIFIPGGPPPPPAIPLVPGGPPPLPGTFIPGGPPPLPAMDNSGFPPKKLIKPTKKMRGFMWQKLPPKVIPGSIWKNIDDECQNIDTKELEDLFGIDPDEKKSVSTTRCESDAASKTAISLLDPKRSNSIEIMLRGLKMNHIEIKNGLMSMDSAFTTEKLKALQTNLPTAEELVLIESYDGDKSELANAEKYFMAIGKIPMLALRVDSLTYKSSFGHKSSELNHTLDTLLQAMKIIKTDKRFHTMLELILALGNYLNGNTNRGQTHGFKISSLAKMGDVKSTKNPQITLMNYFADLLASHKDKSVFQCLKEFNPVHESARESTVEIANQITQLCEGLNPIKTTLNSGTCDASFVAAMGEWMPATELSVIEIQKKNQKVQSSLTELLIQFGEPPNTKSEDFFGLLSSFASSVEQSYIMNEKRRTEATNRERKSTRRISRTNLNSAAVVTQSTQGEYDRILNNMKNGQVFIERHNTLKRLRSKENQT